MSSDENARARGIAFVALIALAGCRGILGIADDVVVASDGGAIDGAVVDGGASDGSNVDGATDCPNARGPAMRRVGGGFCIDTTEVTAANVEAFRVDVNASPTGPPLAPYLPVPAQGVDPCRNARLASTFDRGAWDPTDGGAPDRFPAVNVSFCTAKAYCAWAGKRLCGAMPGKTEDVYSAFGFAVDEWSNACESGSIDDAFPYGATYVPDQCNDSNYMSVAHCGEMGARVCALTAVGSLAGCQSHDAAYAGVFDLVGNAGEWTDVCEGDPPDAAAPTDFACVVRGGAYGDIDRPACRVAESTRGGNRPGVGTSDVHPDLGFRCCAP